MYIYSLAPSVMDLQNAAKMFTVISCDVDIHADVHVLPI